MDISLTQIINDTVERFLEIERMVIRAEESFHISSSEVNTLNEYIDLCDRYYNWIYFNGLGVKSACPDSSSVFKGYLYARRILEERMGFNASYRNSRDNINGGIYNVLKCLKEAALQDVKGQAFHRIFEKHRKGIDFFPYYQCLLLQIHQNYPEMFPDYLKNQPNPASYYMVKAGPKAVYDLVLKLALCAQETMFFKAEN